MLYLCYNFEPYQHKIMYKIELQLKLKKSLNEKKGVYFGTRYKFTNRHYNIDINIDSDPETEKLVQQLTHKFDEEVKTTVGYIGAGLDSRFSVVRAKESTSGVLYAKLVCTYLIL